MTLFELLDGHYAVYRELSKGSLEGIRSAIRTLDRFLGRQSQVEDFSDELFVGLTAHLLTHGLARASVNRVLRTLGALARFANRRRLTTFRPDIEKIPEKRRAPEAWRTSELDRLIKSVGELYGNSPWGRVLAAVLLVAYDSGLRIIDVLGIQRRDCDLPQRIVRVTERKTGKPRAFVLHEQTLEVIRSFACGERLIPYEFKETNPLRKRLREALKSAGLPAGRRDLFQKVRRTTATLSVGAGLDPTEVLGHSARWVTSAYYVDPHVTPAMDVASRLPRPNFEPIGNSILPVSESSPRSTPRPPAFLNEVDVDTPLLLPSAVRRRINVLRAAFRDFLRRRPMMSDLQASTAGLFASWLMRRPKVNGRLIYVGEVCRAMVEAVGASPDSAAVAEDLHKRVRAMIERNIVDAGVRWPRDEWNKRAAALSRVEQQYARSLLCRSPSAAQAKVRPVMKLRFLDGLLNCFRFDLHEGGK